jgi:hypothetical protein
MTSGHSSDFVLMVDFTPHKIIVFEAFSDSVLSSVDAKFLRYAVYKMLSASFLLVLC